MSYFETPVPGFATRDRRNRRENGHSNTVSKTLTDLLEDVGETKHRLASAVAGLNRLMEREVPRTSRQTGGLLTPTIPSTSVARATRIAVRRAVEAACRCLGLAGGSIQVAWFSREAQTHDRSLPAVRDLFGVADCAEGVIYVRADLPPPVAAETVAHEAYHLFQHRAGRHVSEAGARFFARNLSLATGGFR
jgi:hypothetical protein